MSTAMSVGSPRASERRKITSAAVMARITKGVSWWLGTTAAKITISAAISPARRPPWIWVRAAVPGNQRTRIATTTSSVNSAKPCGEK